MNERIKELARRAGAHIGTRNLMSNPPQQVETVELWDDQIEKFAELVVDECCAKLLEMHERTNGSHNYYGHALIELKRHFRK